METDAAVEKSANSFSTAACKTLLAFRTVSTGTAGMNLKQQNRTVHLLQKPDISICYRQAARDRLRETGCERCRPKKSELLFDSILADVLDRHGAFEFVTAESGKCPNCNSEISEKTLVEPQGGIEVGQIS